jgi:hypothetical protein
MTDYMNGKPLWQSAPLQELDPVTVIGNDYTEAFWVAPRAGIVAKDRFTSKWAALTEDGSVIESGLRSKSAAKRVLTYY